MPIPRATSRMFVARHRRSRGPSGQHAPRFARYLALCLSSALIACGPSAQPPAQAPDAPGVTRPNAQPPQAWRDTAPRVGAPIPFRYPVPQIARLDNGLSIYVVSRDTPLVAARVALSSGSGADPTGKSGLAALTARMLTEGTLDKTDLELAEASEDLGSEIVTRVAGDFTAVDLEFLNRDLNAAFALLAEVVVEPRLDPQVFARVKLEWLDHLRGARQDPTQLASIAGMRAVAGPQLGAPTQGSLSGVESLAAGELRRFHAQHYRPDQAALVVAGGVTLANVVDVAQQAFGGWKPASAAEAPSHPERHRSKTAQKATPPGEAPARFKHIFLVDRPGSVQSALFVAERFPARNRPGYDSRELLNEVLGGMFTSRLNQNLREQHGFTYGARSTNYATQRFGVWMLTTSVRTDATVQALREVQRELAQLRTSRPVSAEELARARQELLAGYAKSLEQSPDVTEDIADLFVNHLEPDNLATLGARLNRLDAEAVQQEALERLAPSELEVVIVGDRAAFGAELAGLAAQVSEAPPAWLD